MLRKNNDRADGSIFDARKGSLLLNAHDGHAVGFKAKEGIQPASGNPALTELLNPAPIESPNLGKIPISETKPQVDSSLAKDSARTELVKRLSTNHTYRTASTHHKRVKVLQPKKKKDVEILDFRHVKVPILVGLYQLKERTYERLCLASTGKFIRDDLVSCTTCKDPAAVVCMNCGAICCKYHTYPCTTCGKDSCLTCMEKLMVSKGIFSKKYYCREHAPTN